MKDSFPGRPLATATESTMGYRSALTCLPSMLLLVMTSCTAPARTDNPPPLPGPSTSNVSGTILMNVPAGLVEQLGIAAQIKGDLHIEITSHVIQAKPLRSGYEAKITLVVQDAAGPTRYVDLTTTIDGDCDGPPGKGTSAALTRLAQTLVFMPAPLQAVIGERRKPEPASEPKVEEPAGGNRD